MLKRVILLLTVAALMAAMLVASSAPGFAQNLDPKKAEDVEDPVYSNETYEPDDDEGEILCYWHDGDQWRETAFDSDEKQDAFVWSSNLAYAGYYANCAFPS